MNLGFTQHRNGQDELSNVGQVIALSKAADIGNAQFNSVIQIIDESGNEINCTIDKFIEIFDRQGLEGFIM